MILNRLRRVLFIAVCSVLFFSATSALAEQPIHIHAPLAAPAAPDIFYLLQPDGSKISVYARGDERFNWMETTEGYSIEKAIDGYWYFVSDGNVSSGPVPENKRNSFVLTNVQAHFPPPESLPKHLRPPVLLIAPKGEIN